MTRVIIGNLEGSLEGRVVATVTYDKQPLDPKLPVLLQHPNRIRENYQYFKVLTTGLIPTVLDPELTEIIEATFKASTYYGTDTFSASII